ncbi:MAG: transporter [Sphingobium sp.]|nr:transporter [Sphingobium sp.]MBP6112182.1 transporter [Sphingobium sp.]MBP8670039.1 transporter [Sphingobium sp.]MBP9157096.1 transporter [Sphingobium sp.]MCC6481325.1 transporter [Sphingomonadaceae bacterium]
MNKNRLIAATAMAGAMALLAPRAQAGGFLLQEQSQLEIGRAFSGAAAAADDPSALFYNPAAITDLPGIQLSTGATLLFIDSHQRDLGTTRTGPGATPTQAVGGGNGGNPFAPVVPVPTSFASARLSDRLWLGFGLSAPFGLKLRYEDDFFGRYDSTYSNLLTLDGQMSAGYRLNDAIAIGGGINLQYIYGKLTSAMPALTPGGTDGHNSMKADDVSLGWNAGVLIRLPHDVRVGLGYRSRIKHELKGDYHWELGGTIKDFGVRSPITLPDMLTLGISAPLDTRTKVMISGRYYGWSSFDALKLHFSTGSSGRRDFNYRDSWSVSAGLERTVTDRLTVRGGAMFDRTPTNAAFLSTRVPDGDRTWASGGLSYRLNGHMTLNASYAHVFIAKQDLLRTDSFYTPPATMMTTTSARSSGNVDMLAASVTARF